MHADKVTPSLSIGYEQIKDVLKDQVEVAREYENRAVTLFAIAIAVIGIGIPLLFTKIASKTLWLIPSVIPIAIFVFVCFYFWKVYKLKPMKQMSEPKKIITDFISLEPKVFYSDMLKHLDSAFIENDEVIKHKEKYMAV